MATIRWRGDAPKVAQVVTIVVGGTIEANDNYSVTINSKSVSLVAGSTVLATVHAAILAALQASTIPEFLELTWAGSSPNITGTVKTQYAGKPVTVTVSTTENGGGAADAQTFAITTTTASSGPYDASLAANYSGGALPVSGDTLVLENNSSPMKYGLNALASVTLDVLRIRKSFSGDVGLAKQNTDDGQNPYVEYRPDYLQVGATILEIGGGDGSGSGRIKVDTLAVQTGITVLDAGNPIENGLAAIIWKGTHASNQLEVLKGTVDVAPFAGETANLSGGLRIGYIGSQTSDATVRCGTGVTLNGVVKSGGKLTTESDVVTGAMLANSGEWTHLAGDLDDVTMDGGTLYYRSGGTLALATVGKAILDFRQDPSPRAVTDLVIAAAGAEIHDENETVTWGNPFVLPDGVGLEDITLRVGKGRTLTVA